MDACPTCQISHVYSVLGIPGHCVLGGGIPGHHMDACPKPEIHVYSILARIFQDTVYSTSHVYSVLGGIPGHLMDACPKPEISCLR